MVKVSPPCVAACSTPQMSIGVVVCAVCAAVVDGRAICGTTAAARANARSNNTAPALRNECPVNLNLRSEFPSKELDQRNRPWTLILRRTQPARVNLFSGLQSSHRKSRSMLRAVSRKVKQNTTSPGLRFSHPSIKRSMSVLCNAGVRRTSVHGAGKISRGAFRSHQLCGTGLA